MDFPKNFECAKPFCRNINFTENKWRLAAASSRSCEAGADCPLIRKTFPCVRGLSFPASPLQLHVTIYHP